MRFVINICNSNIFYIATIHASFCTNSIRAFIGQRTQRFHFPIAWYHPDFGLFEFRFFHKLSPRSFDSVTLRSG